MLAGVEHILRVECGYGLTMDLGQLWASQPVPVEITERDARVFYILAD